MCDDTALISVIEQQGELSQLVAAVCSAYSCDDQSDCKVASQAALHN